MIKLIVFVKRNPALSPEEFHRHWRGEHARLVTETPSIASRIVRYEQNSRTAEDYARGEVDFDGVMVAWYRCREDMEAIFKDPAYQEKIVPDEQYLADTSKNVWIVTEEENVVIANATATV